MNNIRRTLDDPGVSREQPGIASQDPRADDRRAAREELQERAQASPAPKNEPESPDEELHEYEPSGYEPDIEKRKAGYGRTGTSSSPQ